MSAYRATSQAAQDVMAERLRQIEEEGWTHEHDDQHPDGTLAFAAACYAGHAGAQAAIDVGPTYPNWGGFIARVQEWVRQGWPWARGWWKPADKRRNLVKAGALILAEIERLDRAAQKGGGA